ncbi:GNAT family N-acetyltransferase [Aliikangiella coralliicola]|uniref:GNAT family N-acetyltransferase n=2 Tax=Aliikangiella coralliicola TaxID=2592383 RepID=A0A545UGS4_9GAMM|nr:GNAT family N-acetyltransferase [Aliikangiella coralliicola]
MSDFNSGNATLDEWLQKRALKNQDSGASRTFVIAEDSKVVGYYSLATGSVERVLTTSNFSRNMPEPIPVVILGRLAIDIEYQGKKLGSHLLKDALLRTLTISNNVGVRGVLVHAISDKAKLFYQSYGFTESPMEPMTLLISVKQLKKYLIPDRFKK